MLPIAPSPARTALPPIRHCVCAPPQGPGSRLQYEAPGSGAAAAGGRGVGPAGDRGCQAAGGSPAVRCHACLKERGPAPAPLAPRRSDRRPPPLQIDVSGFVVHEQLQLSVRNDGPDAAPSLLLCDRNLARAAYLEVRGPIPGCAAGTGSARSMQRRRRQRRHPPPLHSVERLILASPSPHLSSHLCRSGRRPPSRTPPRPSWRGRRWRRRRERPRAWLAARSPCPSRWPRRAAPS